MSEAICPLCEKPVGPEFPGAKVYHWNCLKERYDELNDARRTEKSSKGITGEIREDADPDRT